MENKNKSIIISIFMLVLIISAFTFTIYFPLSEEESRESTSKQDDIISESLENLFSPKNAATEPTSEDTIENTAETTHQSDKTYNCVEEVSYTNVVQQSTQDQSNLTYLGMFEATAYAEDTITSTGSVPIAGQTIAVDPEVIPYGTRVYVEAGDYSGYYIAEDCGGAICGNIIDIYMSSESECIDWGRRYVKVYVASDTK